MASSRSRSMALAPARVAGSSHAKELRRTQYFEVFSESWIYHDGWFASALINARRIAIPDRAQLDPDKVVWELYDLEHDFSQAHNLASQQAGETTGIAGSVVGGGCAQRCAAARLACGRTTCLVHSAESG